MADVEERYQQYLREQRKKYGPDFGEYIGSAFDKPVTTNKVVKNGKYLRSIMPNSRVPIKTSHLDVIKDDCDKYLEIRAKAKKFYARYTIPSIFPGIPLYDPPEVMAQLYEVLKEEREDLIIFADEKRENTLFISWINNKPEKPKRHKKKRSQQPNGQIQ